MFRVKKHFFSVLHFASAYKPPLNRLRPGETRCVQHVRTNILRVSGSTTHSRTHTRAHTRIQHRQHRRELINESSSLVLLSCRCCGGFVLEWGSSSRSEREEEERTARGTGSLWKWKESFGSVRRSSGSLHTDYRGTEGGPECCFQQEQQQLPVALPVCVRVRGVCEECVWADMANIAVQRIKREFKEVLKSEEVRYRHWLSLFHTELRFFWVVVFVQLLKLLCDYNNRSYLC